MRKLTVLRKKAFAGSLSPYWIIAGFGKDIFMEKYNFVGDLCEISAEGMPVSRITIEELDRIGIKINKVWIKETSVAAVCPETGS